MARTKATHKDLVFLTPKLLRIGAKVFERCLGAPPQHNLFKYQIRFKFSGRRLFGSIETNYRTSEPIVNPDTYGVFLDKNGVAQIEHNGRLHLCLNLPIDTRHRSHPETSASIFTFYVRVPRKKKSKKQSL